MKSRGRYSIVLLRMAIVCVAIIGLAGTSIAADMLKWTGCGITRKAIMVELAQGYKVNNNILISLSGGGATKGIRDTSAGKSDMGGSCRPSLPEKYPDEEGNAEMYVVAWDALVPIVHRDNPVKAISSQQLKDILTGKITNWKEVGGSDKKILVVAREGKISGVGYMARKMIFGNPDVDFSPDALVVKSSGPLENKIHVDVDAIGITGVSSAQKRIESGKKLKIVEVDNVIPSAENIASGKYPFIRPLFLTANKNSPSYEKIKKFMEWVLSDKGQEIIASAGTVNLIKGKGLKDKYAFWETKDKIANFETL